MYFQINDDRDLKASAVGYAGHYVSMKACQGHYLNKLTKSVKDISVHDIGANIGKEHREH